MVFLYVSTMFELAVVTLTEALCNKVIALPKILHQECTLVILSFNIVADVAVDTLLE